MIMGPEVPEKEWDIAWTAPPSSSRHRLFLMEINYKACNLVCQGATRRLDISVCLV